MSTTVVKRLPRRPEPSWPSGELVLSSPPELPGEGRQNWARMFMILPMLAGSAAMAMLYSRFGGAGPMRYIPGALFGVAALGMIVVAFSQQAGGKGKKEMIRERRRYLRHLSQQRAQVQKTVAQQRRASFYRHPDPDTLWCIPPSARLWERRRGEADFAQLRIGLGPQELATPMTPPASKPLEDLEPMCALALRRFITTYAVVPDLPVVMALNGFSSVVLRGEPEQARDLCRALIAQIATLHAPDDLLVAVCAGPQRRAEWEWVKWLPHALHPAKTDSLGHRRLVADSVPALEATLDDLLASRPRFNPAAAPGQSSTPHLVVVIDGGATTGSDHLLADGGVDGVTVIALDGQPPRVLDPAKLVLEVAGGGDLRSTTYEGEDELGQADRLSLVEAEALALQLAPLRLTASAGGEQEPLTADLGLAELLRLGDPYQYDPATAWTARSNRQRLRVPIGVGPDGAPVELDLKESAQDGMGPHGLLIGATGSGKSELLRTLVLALAATHDSSTLNFVLVDFKGGATFTRLDRLPHTSAVITNLADELPLVDRMTDAIRGELMRRQELLRAAGNFDSQRDYEQARRAGAPLAPLPSLLVICDEFSELLTAKPDFIDMFLQIGRVGRSLGVHLLLASQRLEEGRLRGLNEYLSYKIGLRTFSGMESRAVLGVPDAYHLPRSPGHGFLKLGTEAMIRFKAAYVSGVHRRAGDIPRASVARAAEQVREYSSAYRPAPSRPEPETAPAPLEEADEAPKGETLLDILVDRLTGNGAAAHEVWLPPLREPSTLDELLPPLSVEPPRGLTVVKTEARGGLAVPVGVVDKPFEQRRDPMSLDLSGAGGHVMVVGAPHSGKSTLLRSIVTALALTHTPREVQCYGLDFGGGGLIALRDLPHVGSVATRRDVSLVRRTIAELTLLLAQREEWFAKHGVDSMATYRRLKREGRFDSDPFGDVFLVVDGWATIRAEFEDLADGLLAIANRGLSFGIHVVASANRWMDVRPTIRDVFGTKLELRLGDPADSVLGRRAAMNVPEHAPGRGITPDGLQFLTALPRLDGRHTVDDLATGVSQLVSEVRGGWSGPGAPAVRLLPAQVPYENIPTGDGPGLPIGIAESNLRPVSLDFAANPHFLLFGAAECGKSSFLRALAQRIVERYSPKQARLLVVDFRRSLLGAVTSDHQIGYGSSAKVTTDLVKEVAQAMRNRLPGPDVTPQQLRERSWWTGPELYLLVDDYDLVTAAQPNPLLPLLEFLPQARDVGLHLILARRSGGAARAMFEQFVMRLRELDTPGLVMSGNRDEGKLLGEVRPSPLPPGRGWLVTRDRTQLVQIVHRPPAEDASEGGNR